MEPSGPLLSWLSSVFTVVPRERLLERLRAGSGLALSLVAGPAGFGKTTLLAAWREAEAARRPAGWLTLDEGDNDPVVLWSYVIQALRRACPALSVPVSPQLAGAASVVSVVLPRLVNELDDLGEVTLILDDFHRLSAGPARESIAWFVGHAPPAFQLVLSTRTEPDLPLAALRAHGDLLELRAGDLRFTAGEADAFLNGRLALGLLPEEVDALVEQLEGWPAGLYLTALSLRGAADRPGLVTGLGASSRHLIDFLETEVLRALGERGRSQAALTEAASVIGSCPDPGILTGRLSACGPSPRAGTSSGGGELTRRERRVLQLLTSDLSERDISQELYVSHNTVHSHVRSIYRKHGVSSRAHALQRTRELRLL